MAITKEEVFQAAEDLPNEDRQELIERLLETMDESAEIERAWLDVAQERLQNYRAGRTTGRPASEVFESLRAQRS